MMGSRLGLSLPRLPLKATRTRPLAGSSTSTTSLIHRHMSTAPQLKTQPQRSVHFQPPPSLQIIPTQARPSVPLQRALIAPTPHRTLVTLPQTQTQSSSAVQSRARYQQRWQQYQQYAHAAGQRASSEFKKWSIRLAIALAFPAIYLLGAVFPPKLVLLLMPRYAPPPPDKDDPRGKAMMSEVEADVQGLAVVERMRMKEGWYETRPYQRFDPNKVHNSLTAGSLRGPGRLAIPPILFAKNDESEAMAVIHLGRALCGHDGIIHGGLISTVFDESLARNALLNLPSNIGVTASLTVDFKSPCHADQFVIVRTKLGTVKGRKVTVSGTMETLEGERIAEAKALFVEPKWAQFLQSSGVTEALGRPMPNPHASPALLDGATERII